MWVTPSQNLPPIGFSAVSSRDFESPLRNSAGKKRTLCAAISSIAAQINSNTPVLTRCTSNAVIIGPRIPPSEPPTAIKPKRRFPCSFVNRSVMKPQNTAVANRLKTLTQTKKQKKTKEEKKKENRTKKKKKITPPGPFWGGGEN